MGTMRRQGDGLHRIAKISASKGDHVVEPDQRLVIAVLAIGMIIGALVTPASSEPAKPARAVQNASAAR